MYKYAAAALSIAVAIGPAAALDVGANVGGIGIGASVGVGRNGASVGVGASAGGIAEAKAGASAATGKGSIGVDVGSAADVGGIAGANVGTSVGASSEFDQCKLWGRRQHRRQEPGCVGSHWDWRQGVRWRWNEHSSGDRR